MARSGVHGVPVHFTRGCLIAYVGLVANIAAARCGDLPGDAAAVTAARAQVSSQCNCASAGSHGDYMKCARGVVIAAKGNGLSTNCAGSVLRCAAKSTCGKPGAVTCCRTGARGVVRCGVKRSASRCGAPPNGSVCIGQLTSCCDACGASGCITPTPTVTPTVTPTPTVPSVCESLVMLPRLGRAPVTLGQGTTDCGGGALSPPPQPPFSGRVDDVNGVKLKDLGLGCLNAGTLPGLRLPGGSTAVLDVVGVGLGTITLAGSDGNSQRDCTKGALLTRHCVNGAPGTDTTGSCASDADCGGLSRSCANDARCFFGPPLPISDPIPVCVVAAFQGDLCGSLNLLSQTATFHTSLSSRLYSTQDAQAPCPLCVSGTCSGGLNVGGSCSVSSIGTSADCPPIPSQWFATLDVTIPALTNGTATLSDPSGVLCPGQLGTGGLGLVQATAITELATPTNLNGTNLTMQLGAAFCVPPTGTGLIDGGAGLPGAGALSATGSVDLSAVLGLPGP